MCDADNMTGDGKPTYVDFERLGREAEQGIYRGAPGIATFYPSHWPKDRPMPEELKRCIEDGVKAGRIRLA